MRWGTAVLAATLAACGRPAEPTRPPFTGRWLGTYVVRQCTPIGWSSCDSVMQQVGSIHALDLTLTQTGLSTSGTLNVTESPTLMMLVTGAVTQNTLTITGTVTEPTLNRVSTDVVRIMEWASTVDPAGRMQGTFRFRRETLWGPGNMQHPVGDIWTLDANAELLNVPRQP